jgi:hypothetical protein
VALGDRPAGFGVEILINTFTHGFLVCQKLLIFIKLFKKLFYSSLQRRKNLASEFITVAY